MTTHERLARKAWLTRLLEKSWGDLSLSCYKQLGFALLYMNYLQGPKNFFGSQVGRVEKLCREAGESSGKKSKLYWAKFYIRITDEIENMC